jgi:hypothetical protein
MVTNQDLVTLYESDGRNDELMAVTVRVPFHKRGSHLSSKSERLPSVRCGQEYT